MPLILYEQALTKMVEFAGIAIFWCYEITYLLRWFLGLVKALGHMLSSSATKILETKVMRQLQIGRKKQDWPKFRAEPYYRKAIPYIGAEILQAGLSPRSRRRGLGVQELGLFAPTSVESQCPGRRKSSSSRDITRL